MILAEILERLAACQFRLVASGSSESFDNRYAQMESRLGWLTLRHERGRSDLSFAPRAICSGADEGASTLYWHALVSGLDSIREQWSIGRQVAVFCDELPLILKVVDGKEKAEVMSALDEIAWRSLGFE